MKNFTAKFVLSLLISIAVIPLAHASYYNLGTLDVRPVESEATTNKEWFVEYLQPGETKQQQIQISNFSSTAKNLSVYVSDTKTNDGKTFQVEDLEKNSEDISKWVDLPTETLVLGPGESKILSVNFKLPQNAGVGLHTGAIIVREKIDADMQGGPAQTIALEKGVRIYLNVTGAAITEGNITKISSSSGFNQVEVKIQTANSGTTDYQTDYKLELKDLFGKVEAASAGSEKIKPGTVKNLTITGASPRFGIHEISISNGAESSHLGAMVFIPLWAVLLLGGLTFGISISRSSVKVSAKKHAVLEHFSVKDFLEILRRAVNSLEVRKSLAYFGMLSIVTVSTLSIADFDPHYAKSQLLTDRSALSYELTVKWGNFRNMILPNTYHKQWHGRIFFPNARITTMELLHFERTDEAEITGDKSALRFNTFSGPDNDGIVLKVEPTGNEVPMVRYENFDNDETYEFKITDYIGAEGIYPDGLFSTYFKTEYGEEAQQSFANNFDTETLSELEATAEREATPPVVAQIPELENLFIEDLPATPEALTDFILTSDYVEEIVQEKSTTTIETDSILMQALEATPEVLQDIVATPDLNFVFIPTETITFPPETFSFDESKVTGQDLGTLIFVQNKETPWNTYISTTDFRLLSGSAVIPASAIKIIPGEPILLSEDGAEINTSKTKNFKDEDDKLTLVTVDPNARTKEVFAMRPRLEVRIPAGTPAGTYQGTLTITSL